MTPKTAFEALKKAQRLYEAVHEFRALYEEHPELNDFQPASFEGVIPMSLDEWESMLSESVHDWAQKYIETCSSMGDDYYAGLIDPSGESRADAKDLRELAKLVRTGHHKEAYKHYRSLDTFVREAVPTEVVDYIDGSYSKVAQLISEVCSPR